MRKLFLTLVTALLCNVVSFAQSGIIEISSAEDFLKIGTNSSYPANGSYQQTADIDLGDRGPSAIISSFSGTYDGNGYNITYGAAFSGSGDNKTYALFGTVTGNGTIKNLNLDANVTMSASGSDMRCGLLCGYLQDQGKIEYCNVTGNINSTANAGFMGSSGTGMIAGRCDGTIQYCTASGNVSAPGYVGGIAGQLGGLTAWGHDKDGHIKGCSFNGGVTATRGGALESLVGAGSFAGGICGFATTNSKVELCYVNADVNSSSIVTGAGGTNNKILWIGKGKPTITNNYCEGTVNGEPIDAGGDITNSGASGLTNYYEGQQITGLQTADNGSGVEFAVINGEVVFIIGGFNKVCETPTNLTITKNDDGTHTADWDVAGTDNTVQESKWRWTLSGGNLATASQGEVNAKTLSSSLEASPNPYTFTVYTDCSTDQNGLLSGSASIEFFVDCPTPTGLTASDITDNGFIISWNADVDCQLTVNGIDYEISAGNLMEKTITGLEPETTYNIIVKAKCGGEYVEQATTNVTTARLAAPTGLAVNTVWNGEDGFGTATINWDMVDGLTYEIEGQTGDKESGFAISNLAENNYTLRLRAKKGTKTSDWVSMPYTISSPDAPKMPQVIYTRNGNEYNVTVSWTAGSTPNNGWIVNGGGVQNTASYVLTAQTPGYVTTLSIVEKVGLSTSRALQVPIQVPCLPATLPDTVSTTQTSATFTFSQAIEGRKVIIGSNPPYPASATSITIDGLTSGTTYSYEVREYCNETQYSSVIANFATVACLQVSNLATSNIGTNSAKVSWSSQSSLNGLQYQVVLKKGETIVSTQTQPEKMITFNSLDKAAEYTVEVSETCGSDWGTPKTVTFTTLGDYSTVKTGAFNVATTWEGGNIPDGNDGNIIINQGHTLTLNVDLVLTGECRILNQGVLEIPAGKQLINTTDENVGGIIEVSTPQKTIDQWTFIGAPFKSGYKLGSIKPVSGSDVAMVEYDYNIPGWSDYFVNYQTTMEAAEGAFAWPFYTGVITFSTYDLGQNGTSYPDNAVADYELNNDDVQVKKYIKHTTNNPATDVNEEGNWMALANPYPAKLSVKAFVDANDPEGDPEIIQGRCVYVFRNGSFDINATDILMTEGFFVNFKSASTSESDKKSVTFTKDQLSYNQPAGAKSSANEFIELTLQNGKDKVRVYFAHNEDAEQGYDIFDANKMFATTGVAEPYFVTDGIALIKEEVRDLPYYATMNVRSQEDTVMNFVLTNLPEGYAVSIIDGEEVIDLVEGGVYSTEIASGENADRFKVLVKKNVGLADVEELDVRITNSNRHITITAQENVRTEVYNTLGQKVFETEETNFVLSGVASGAYVVKVQGAKASKSQKIVVE